MLCGARTRITRMISGIKLKVFATRMKEAWQAVTPPAVHRKMAGAGGKKLVSDKGCTNAYYRVGLLEVAGSGLLVTGRNLCTFEPLLTHTPHFWILALHLCVGSWLFLIETNPEYIYHLSIFLQILLSLCFFWESGTSKGFSPSCLSPF